MTILVPEKYARPLTGIIRTVCDRYSGLPRESHTLANFEKELVSEVYKYLYLNDELKLFNYLKNDLKNVSRLLDPYRPKETLEIVAFEDVEPVDTVIKGTFV